MMLKEYYKNYLTLHQNKACRRLHIVGNLATIVYVSLCMFFHVWLLLLAAPFVVYPFAWTGHLYYEKNTPAAWSNPIQAKICDWLMMKDIFTGKIEW